MDPIPGTGNGGKQPLAPPPSLTPSLWAGRAGGLGLGWPHWCFESGLAALVVWVWTQPLRWWQVYCHHGSVFVIHYLPLSSQLSCQSLFQGRVFAIWAQAALGLAPPSKKPCPLAPCSIAPLVSQLLQKAPPLLPNTGSLLSVLFQEFDLNFL
mgnify:CR=1 FL=1